MQIRLEGTGCRCLYCKTQRIAGRNEQDKSQMSQLASTIKYCADRIQREDQRVAELAAALKAGH